MGYLPPLTRIGALDGDGNRTFLTGDVKLDAGIGLAYSRNTTSGALQLDGQNIAPGAPSGVFLPGALTPALERLRMSMNTDDGAGYLSLLEVLPDTAATGQSAVDGTTVRVRGSISGSQDVHLTDDGRHFSWSGKTAVPVGGVNTGAGATNGPGNFPFAGSQFKTTAKMAIKNVGIAFWNNTPDTFRVWILNADRTEVLAQSLVLTAAGTTVEWIHPYHTFGVSYMVPLTKQISLEQDQSFWVIGEAVGAPARVFGAYRHNNGDAADYGTSGYTGSVTGGAVAGIQGFASMFGPALANQGANTTILTAFTGSPGGVRLEGDVIIDVLAIGAGPTTPPADANVRLVFAGNQP